MRALGILLLLAVTLGGCAFDHVAFPGPTSPLPRSIAAVPPPPPPAPPSPPAVKSPPSVAPPSPPPRVLSVGVEDETRMRREARTRIDEAERLIGEIDRGKLRGQQERNFQTIESFLGKAKDALIAQDLQRALTLADKAYALADELSRTLSAR